MAHIYINGCCEKGPLIEQKLPLLFLIYIFSSFCLSTTLVCLPLFIVAVYVDIHTEAVQAALAKHKEEKMALPMPTKRRSAFVQSPIETCTPPGKLDLTLSG